MWTEGQMSMDNAMYYTLSTISQTLAGALAVLVAVVLLRLQQCDTTLAKGEDLFFSNILNNLDAWRVFLEEGSNQVTARGFEMPKAPDPRTLVACEAARVALRTRRQIIKRLRVSLGLTIPTIGLCIIALPFTPRLADVACLAMSVLAISVLLSLGCLGMYAWLIIGTITHGPKAK
jgi:hypothetical protein